MLNTAVWQTRWRGIADTLEEMDSDYGKLASPTFRALSACLQAFAKDQFDFFLDGFHHGRLLPSPQHPAENILRATLDQISFDLTVVQLAVDQRQDGSAAMRKALDKADALAQNALALAINARLIKAAVAVTYFNKATNVRVIPYAPVALVGLPFTSITASHDFLAIPHEVGHYVYRHAPGLAAALEVRLRPSMPVWAAGWLEEIFADVYGALVAGPVIGLDFQDLLLDNPLASLTEDDGDHPADAVRPFIYTRLLQQLGYPHAASALQSRWQKALAERGHPQTLTAHDGSGEIPLDTARTAVEETAVSILNYLIGQRGVKATAVWSEDLASSQTDPESLYAAFATWLETHPAAPVQQLKIQGDEAFVAGGEDDNRRRLGETQTWRDWFKAQSRAHPNDALPTAVWTEIFTVGGWPIKGPDSGGGGGLP
ncbi:MAG: hypothetical protein H6659_00765 [Ardenticatenaceae bacterium]|nr:hypothetical protein [Ardenticatenaceae bacterium]